MKHLDIILDEMFCRVNVAYNKDFIQEQDWFLEYSWTEEEQDSFIDWLSKYLYNNAKARKEIMTISARSKKYCQDAAKWFVFAYGWTCKTN